jgi:hypothetical protein
MEQGHGYLPSAVVGVLGPADQLSSVRRCTVVSRTPPVHYQIRAFPARQRARCRKRTYAVSDGTLGQERVWLGCPSERELSLGAACA